MKTILVTGGAGFIGSNFVRYIYEKYPEYKIMVLDSLTYAGRVENLPERGLEAKRCEFWYGDIRNGQLMDTLVSKADIVIHMAAETHVTRSIYDNLLFFETDVMGTHSVANAVLNHKDKVELFVHMSTSEVYGTALSDLMTEGHPLNPMSPYAAAKCGADRLVYSYFTTYRLPVVIVRPFNNYGPYQHLEKLIPRFITSCILDEPLTVHGDGSASRDWLFVEDHCDALDKLIHFKREDIIGKILNIGTCKSVSILEIADTIKKLMNKPDLPIELIGDRPGQVFRHTCSYQKLNKLLGWNPNHNFEEGLLKTIEWYRNNTEWWMSQKWMRHIPIVSTSGRRELH